jgi:hypothetical protein
MYIKSKSKRKKNIPSFRIMCLPHGITSTNMRSCKDPFLIERELHKLIHIASYEYIPVEQDNTLIFFQREDDELVPCFGEARVLRVAA